MQTPAFHLRCNDQTAYLFYPCHKRQVSYCLKSLGPLLKVLTGSNCLHTAGGKASGPYLRGLVSEEDTLTANLSFLEYCISHSHTPYLFLSPWLLQLTFENSACLHWTKSLIISENGKGRTLTDRSSMLIRLTLLRKQAKVLK